jgi:hypothetical protein
MKVPSLKDSLTPTLSRWEREPGMATRSLKYHLTPGEGDGDRGKTLNVELLTLTLEHAGA